MANSWVALLPLAGLACGIICLFVLWRIVINLRPHKRTGIEDELLKRRRAIVEKCQALQKEVDEARQARQSQQEHRRLPESTKQAIPEPQAVTASCDLTTTSAEQSQHNGAELSPERLLGGADVGHSDAGEANAIAPKVVLPSGPQPSHTTAAHDQVLSDIMLIVNNGGSSVVLDEADGTAPTPCEDGLKESPAISIEEEKAEPEDAKEDTMQDLSNLVRTNVGANDVSLQASSNSAESPLEEEPLPDTAVHESDTEDHNGGLDPLYGDAVLEQDSEHPVESTVPTDEGVIQTEYQGEEPRLMRLIESPATQEIEAMLRQHQVEMVQALVDGVALAMSSWNIATAAPVLDVLSKLLKNICAHPEKPQYQRINLQAQRMAPLWRLSSVRHMLQELGFKVVDGGTHLQFEGDLKILKSILQVLLQGLQQIERQCVRNDAASQADNVQYEHRCSHCHRGIRDRVTTGDAWNRNNTWIAMEERSLDYRYQCTACTASLCETCHQRYANGHPGIHTAGHPFVEIAPQTRFHRYGVMPPPPPVGRRGPWG